MKEKILDIAEKIFNDPDLLPHDITGDNKPETFCNIAVWRFMENFGYSKFVGKLANQIIDYMLAYPSEWNKTRNHVEAHAAVNAGYVAIAGLMGIPHGHVVIVLPSEEMVFSGKWDTLVPLCMNIGKTNFINKGVNHAFKEPPVYYIWRGVEI